MKISPSSQPGLYQLLFCSGPAIRVVNLITLYRILAAPVLVYLLFNNYPVPFKWLLLFSFSTDAIDGFLARTLNAGTHTGAMLDSIGDVLTLVAAFTGIVYYRPEFIAEQYPVIYSICFLFVFQVFFALIRYKKLSSFHTYLAKISAVLQGVFMLTLFFFSGIIYFLFYLAAFFTIIALIEEIILTYLIPEWKTDVRGLYWYMINKIV
jgi:CDP-diacylglycerol--glycerol-3-phosphate 3-phosphatidyltransferase